MRGWRSPRVRALPEVLVQQTTGLSKAESNALVRVGSKPEFLAPVAAGVFGVAKVDAVRGGLGVPTESVTADDLLLAATRVAEESSRLDGRAGGGACAGDA